MRQFYTCCEFEDEIPMQRSQTQSLFGRNIIKTLAVGLIHFRVPKEQPVTFSTQLVMLTSVCMTCHLTNFGGQVTTISSLTTQHQRSYFPFSLALIKVAYFAKNLLHTKLETLHSTALSCFHLRSSHDSNTGYHRKLKVSKSVGIQCHNVHDAWSISAYTIGVC
jgi:hypothetical protein